MMLRYLRPSIPSIRRDRSSDCDGGDDSGTATSSRSPATIPDEISLSNSSNASSNVITKGNFKKSRRSFTDITPRKSPRMNGDYQVLHQSVCEQRMTVRNARTTLASTLDRLGEHHVRNKEYDEAMDAFAEALHEKRSVHSQLVPSVFSRGNSSLSQETDEGDSILGSVLSNQDNDTTANEGELHDQTIDDIILTLRNMGNVHSLRGEQDEAMRYYAEVTSLRASLSCSRGDGGSLVSRTRNSVSGNSALNDDNSAMMSELNEDVRALDDLFRSISFRNGSLKEVGVVRTDDASTKSKPLSPCDSNRKRRRGEIKHTEVKPSESEPFKRSSSQMSHDKGLFASTSKNDELNEALDLYRSVIASYRGENLDHHDERLNSLALRADIINQNKKRQRVDAPKDGDGQPEREEELDLALEIYQDALSAQEEMKENPLQDSDEEPGASAKIASTLIRMGSIYYKLNEVDEELNMYQQAKKVYKLAFGSNHSYVAGTRKNIGMVLAERGEYDLSMEQFEKARKIYLSVNNGSEECREVASALSCMANVKNRMGELDDALNRYMKALDIYKSILAKAQEEDSEVVPDALNDVTSTLKIIGMVHGKKGDLDTAMEFFSEAMALLRTSTISNTKVGLEGKASILTRIACIYYKKGEYDQAMSHYNEAYDLATTAHGTTHHPDIAGILHYIGGINHKNGKFNEAMTCYQEAVRIYHATLGPGNPAVATTLVCIGSIHYKERNLDSAMMFYREAFRLNRDAYGLHHPDVAPTLKSIGMILTKKGIYDEAYDVFRDVLSIKCTVHGTGHPEVANAYKSLGNVHYKRGELADAEREYRHALSIYRRARGEDHPDTIAARTTIEHLRQHMREHGQKTSRGSRGVEGRNARSSNRGYHNGDRS